MYIECSLSHLSEKKSLSEEEAYGAARELLETGDAAQTAAFLSLLKAKGETVEEITGLVNALREEARPVPIVHPILDIVGTGGDRAGTANISTGAALLAALSGIPVVKHGNRSVSSKSGSADVLEALGFDIHAPVNPESNFNFCFAPDYHPALQKVREVRKALKFPTVFNILGPLLNPAGISHLQIGVFRPDLVPIMAEVLFRLGTKRSLVFHGHGLDELSCLGPIDALLVTEKGIEPFRIDPAALGLKICTMEDLKGGDAKDNSEMLLAVLRGEESPIRDTLILNAAVGQYLYGSVKSLEEGVAALRQKLKSALKNHAVIAEIKRASPSKGKIGEIRDVSERASLYVQGGAAALSVLTDPAFDGRLRDLQQAAKECPVPILRKGFFYEKKDVRDAKLNGADAILLIASALKKRTSEMVKEAKRFGLDALVEVHTEEELRFALDAGAEIVGVNQRDLRDFSMHPEVQAELIGKIPPEIVRVAESGVSRAEDAKRAFSLGYDAILVGEALTRAEDPLTFLSTLRQRNVG